MVGVGAYRRGFGQRTVEESGVYGGLAVVRVVGDEMLVPLRDWCGGQQQL